MINEGVVDVDESAMTGNVILRWFVLFLFSTFAEITSSAFLFVALSFSFSN
jgi:hypothetical protein